MGFGELVAAASANGVKLFSLRGKGRPNTTADISHGALPHPELAPTRAPGPKLEWIRQQRPLPRGGQAQLTSRCQALVWWLWEAGLAISPPTSRTPHAHSIHNPAGASLLGEQRPRATHGPGEALWHADLPPAREPPKVSGRHHCDLHRRWGPNHWCASLIWPQLLVLVVCSCLTRGCGSTFAHRGLMYRASV